jgi:SNF2 family DNA or RNA helicase
MDDQHVYGVELGPADPLAPQPNGINVLLKPHQRAALHKAMVMEAYGRIYYDVADPAQYLTDYYARRNIMFRGPVMIESNLGVLGDIVGYGKTLTALAIIAATPCERIYRSEHELCTFSGGRDYVHFTASRQKRLEPPVQEFIHTTLVVVPRGPVFVQWEKAIQEQTHLKVLAIDSLPTIRKKLPPSGAAPEVIRAHFEQFDVVLVKSTALKTFMEYYEVPYREHPITAWDRIMIDEAHEILNRVHIFAFRFLWLISGTYPSLLHRLYGTRNQMSYAVRDIITEERMNLLLLKGQQEFVRQSFTVPLPIEHYHLCQMPRNLAAVQPFLSPTVQERINANDIQGAIRELGGHNETEDDIVHLLTKESEREIRNKEREIAFIEELDVPREQKEARLMSLRTDLQRMNDRLKNIMERVTALSEKTCPICYDGYQNPIVLPCTHVFCGNCLLHWMRAGHVCPECRAPIHSRRLIAIVKEKAEHPQPHIAPVILSKEDTLLKLLREKPQGRFLVFSRCDFTFFRLTDRLTVEGITHAEIKGSTPTMMKILERFRNGELRVILLNTHHAGSGIDISCATDVVIFHSMGLDKTQAVGRAQRVGRTEPLVIHNLCYPNEMHDPEDHM